MIHTLIMPSDNKKKAAAVEAEKPLMLQIEIPAWLHREIKSTAGGKGLSIKDFCTGHLMRIVGQKKAAPGRKRA